MILNTRAGAVFFKSQKVTATYYDIENPLPDVISKLCRFLGLLKMPLVGCQVPLVARMATEEAIIAWEKLR